MPLYTGCQNYIVNGIFRHVLDFHLSKMTIRMNLKYKLSIRRRKTKMPKKQKHKWTWTWTPAGRMIKAFQDYKKYAAFPAIKWSKLTSRKQCLLENREPFINTLNIFYFHNGKVFCNFQLASLSKNNKKKWQEAWFFGKNSRRRDMTTSSSVLPC